MPSKSSNISSSRESGVFHSKCVSELKSKSHVSQKCFITSASLPFLTSDPQKEINTLTVCSGGNDTDTLKNNSENQGSESKVDRTSSENFILGLPQSVAEKNTCNLKSSLENLHLKNFLQTNIVKCDNTQESENQRHNFLSLEKNSTSSPVSSVILSSNVIPADIKEQPSEKGKNVLLIGRDLLISQTGILSYKNPNKNLDVEVKLGEKNLSNNTSVDRYLTTEKPVHKCQVLQDHGKQCECSTPRLHVYLTSNHRCTDFCSFSNSINSVLSNCGTSLAQSSPNCEVHIVSPADMSGKSRGRGRKRKSISRKLPHKNTQLSEALKKNSNFSSSITQSSKAIIKNTSLQRKNTIANIKKLNSTRNNQRDEPESELLQEEECESLPTIMNALSGDVEYIVLDDDTLNLNATVKEVPVVSPDILKSKINNIYEDIDVKPDIHNTEGRLLNTNRLGLTVRRLSESTNQPSGSRGYNRTTDVEKTNEDLIEKVSDDTAASSSLDVACTNHSPSLKDIFGDISIKEEPVEDIKQDMTVDDFSKELCNFSNAGMNPKENFIKKEKQDEDSTKGLFAKLIKEESITNELDVDTHSSDDSLGPLQIDEDRIGYLPSFEDNNLSVTKELNEFSMPSVNIISPFKIKILFGNINRDSLQIQAEPTQIGTSVNSIPFINPNKERETNVSDTKNYKQVIKPGASDKFEEQLQIAVGANTIQSLTCIYCNTKCPNGQELAKHFEDHQKEGLIICYFCQKSFGDKTGMKRHMRTHTGEKPYQCNVCGKRFSLPGNFKKHRDIHEDRRTEPCSVCGKTFRRKEHLKYHMRTHTGEKPYTCSECGTSFTARYSLQIHMNIHLGKKPYQCNYCNKAFSDKSTMRKHIRVHTGEKPFRCPECRRCFGESGTLAAHMATHRTERPFKCNKCELRFKTNGGLRQHEKVHSGEKQFACRFCGMRFLQKYNMTMHERIHTGEKPYSCPHCDRSFRSRSCLSKHVVLHGGDDERRFHCDHCSSRFYRKAHLRRHIDMHLGIKNYECNICSKKFCTRGTLKSHLKTFHSHGARRFPCNWCGRVFKRQVYVSTHVCIKDTVKTEEGVQETHDSHLDSISEGVTQNQENSSDSDGSSIEVKSEPEDDIIEEVEEYDTENFHNEDDDGENDEDIDVRENSLTISEDFHQNPS